MFYWVAIWTRYTQWSEYNIQYTCWLVNVYTVASVPGLPCFRVLHYALCVLLLCVRDLAENMMFSAWNQGYVHGVCVCVCV